MDTGEGCPRCAQVLAWLARSVPLDLVVEGSAVSAQALATHLAGHGHAAEADLIDPSRTRPTPGQGGLF